MALDGRIFSRIWNAKGQVADSMGSCPLLRAHDGETEAEEANAMSKLPTKEDCMKTGKIVEALAAANFPKARIVRADVKADWDHDGDPVMWVRVVLDAPTVEHIDTSAVFEMKHQVSNELDEIGIPVDTVITYALYAEVGDAA